MQRLTLSMRTYVNDLELRISSVSCNQFDSLLRRNTHSMLFIIHNITKINPFKFLSIDGTAQKYIPFLPMNLYQKN
jgi:hypothetical protein